MNTLFRMGKKIKFYQWMLVCILILAAFIRLYQSTEYIPFWEEQVDDVLSIRSIWHDVSTGNFTHLSLKGQSGTYRSSYLQPKEASPVYHGVLYYYLLLPAAAFSQFNPYGVVLFLIFVGLGVIYLLFDAGVLLYGSRSVGIVAAFLGATSFWLSAYSRWIWTPSMMPFFSLLSLVSFLRVISGKTRWWYPLVLSLSFSTQIHDSGYVPFVFFIVALIAYRPSLPRGIWSKVWLIFLLFMPLVPTVWNEFSENFHMVRALSVVAYNAIPTYLTIGVSFFKFILSAFGVTIMSQRYIHGLWTLLWSYPSVSFLCSVIFIAGIYGVLRLNAFSSKKKIFHDQVRFSHQVFVISWWVSCLLVSVFVEYLYADQILNDYSRMNNLAFALPMVFLCVAYGCVFLWKSARPIWRVVVVIGVFVFVSLNVSIMHDYLWTYTERDWGYSDLKNASWLIPHHAGTDPYDLVVYRYQEGSYENKTSYVMLYFIELYPARMPETFNGITTWGVTKEPLQGRSTHQRIIVIDKRYVGYRELPKSAQLVAQTQGYNIYRTEY